MHTEKRLLLRGVTFLHTLERILHMNLHPWEDVCLRPDQSAE
jgi:hypothetical protein